MSKSAEEPDYYQWSEITQIDQTVVDLITTTLNFDKVTRVQKAVIPLFLSNKDVCVKACTGSGKTLSFAVPLVQQLLKLLTQGVKPAKSEVYALILAPSRELAVQIYKVIEHFQVLVPQFKFCYFIGGNKIQYDLQRIKETGCNVVVGTVGRIFDLYQKDIMNFKKIEMFIMDEADRMLDIGHEQQINHIFGLLPKQRRTGLFSATMTSQLKNMIKLGMRNPFFVDVRVEDQGIFALKGPKEAQYVTVKEFDVAMDRDEFQKQVQSISEVPTNLHNFFTVVEHQAEKLPALMGFLESIESSRIIMFFATCASVDFHMIVMKVLFKEKASLFKLHGKIDQKKRAKIYNEFKNQPFEKDQKHQILLTTDLAARGIDIPDVDWIVQYDPPQDSDQYVHRIGRTARAGRSGSSLIYLMKHEDPYTEFLRKKQVKLDEYPEVEPVITIEEVKEIVRTEMKQDRDIIDKASSAFVSFVRYYKEQSLQFIFAMNTLDIGQVANSFFLFKVPRVKEILGKSLKNFVQDNSVKYEEVPYVDKNKEKQKEGVVKKRQEKLQWKVENKEQKVIKDKEQAKVRSFSQKKRRKQENDWNEWEDLKNEENLYKKLKKGKISEQEFNKLCYDSDFEDL